MASPHTQKLTHKPWQIATIIPLPPLSSCSVSGHVLCAVPITIVIVATVAHLPALFVAVAIALATLAIALFTAH
jgi:hypothetical protein